MGRKTFFKKTDVLHSYKVVPRSQQDPLIADEKAPKSVLVDIKEGEKYGVYFDDDYNYLQHLKGVTETVNWQDGEEAEVYYIKAPAQPKKELTSGFSLPSSVFESHVEEPIGMLNKAAPVTGPQPNLDPDILDGLDEPGELDTVDEGEFDNMLSMLNMDCLGAMALPIDDDNDDVLSCHLDGVSDLSLTDIDSCDEDDFFNPCYKPATTNKSETGFTEYSLTSANMPRSEHQEFMNKRYEAFYLKHYAEDKRDVTEEQARGFLDAKDAFANMIEPRERKGFAQDFPDEREFNKAFIANFMNPKGPRPPPTKRVKEPKKRVLKYDCVTYHEALGRLNPYVNDSIDDPNYKKVKLTKKSLAQHDARESTETSESGNSVQEGSEVGGMTFRTAYSLASIRNKDETREQKLERRHLVKALKRARRVEKKLTKLEYKEQKKIHASKPKTVRFRSLP